MPEPDSTPTPAPQPNAQPAPAAPASPPASSPADGGKEPPWGSDENFDPAKAWQLIQNLRKDADSELQKQVEDMKKANDDQRAALARALGVAPEETSDAERLAETVSQLQQQMRDQQLKATRLEVAAAHQIPQEFQGWLTATEPDALKAQAEQLVPMVQATLASRGQAPLTVGQAPITPQFVANPAQGQAGGPISPQQESAQGYAQYYDENGRLRK